MPATERAALLPILTAYRPPTPALGRIAAWLLAAGLRLVSTLGGWAYADCPACGAFAALTVDPDRRRWRSGCGCYGRRPLGEPEAVALFHGRSGYVA